MNWKKQGSLAILVFIILTNTNHLAHLSAQTINLQGMKFIGTVDARYQSYNIEMCEVVGGDFWIPYELMDSVSKKSNKTGFAALKWKIEPINLYQQKLRKLAKALGPTYVRVSGTWANDIYFQNNEEAIMSKPPAGFNYILTRDQWKGVVDFCKEVDGKIVSSFAISDGMHDANGKYKVEQVKEIIDYTKAIGGEIYAAEMFNEPTFASHGSAPKGYNAQSYAKDFAVFKDFVRKYYPQMLVQGPGAVGEGGILQAATVEINTEDIMKNLGPKPFDIYSYHYYGGASQRCMGKQTLESVLTEEWLSKTEKAFQFYKESRDKYNPGAPMWLNETAEAACGGDPLAATFTDSFRYLEQLGRLAKLGVQSVMHNTLARSEYALLDNDTHDPRPNYWAALLWNKLMGTEVFDGGSLTQGVDIFVHNMKGNPNGRTMLILNTTDKESTVNIPKKSTQYLVTADELLTKKIKLNGTELRLTKADELPDIKGKKLKAGAFHIPPKSFVFLAVNKV